MSSLTKMLEYVNASETERKRMIDKESFVKSIGEKKRKELLESEELDDGYLVRREIIYSIVKGTDYNKVMRDALPVLRANSGYKGKAVTHTHMNMFADIVPEGGKIPLHQGDYGYKNFDYKKIGTRIQITDELIEDSEWNEIELEFKLAGSRIENALNRYALGVLLDGCTGSNQDGLSVDNMTEAMEDIRDEHYLPDTMIYHQSGAADLYDTAALLNAKIDITSRGEGTRELMGFRQFTLGMNTMDTVTSKWDSTDSANHFYGFMFDSLRYARIVIRDDISVKQMDNWHNDIKNLIAKMRVGVVVTHPKAGVRFLSV